MPKPNDPIWKVAFDRPEAAVFDHKPSRGPNDPEVYYVRVSRTIEVNIYPSGSISTRGRWPRDESEAAVWAAKRAKGLI